MACLTAVAGAVWLPQWGIGQQGTMVARPGEPSAQIRIPVRRPSVYTPFPPATMAATKPICFGDTYDVNVWIGKRGVGFSKNCKTLPTRWANLNRPVSHFAPPRQIDLSVVRTLYLVARRDGFATLPTSLSNAMQDTCYQGCLGDFNFMEFGGRTVYDGNGYAEAWACNYGSPGGVWAGSFRVVGWAKRFARLFATVAALTPFCPDLDRNPPVE